METYTLNNGIDIPCMGLGTFRIKPDACENAVRCALEKGYRLIDTANIYFNEKAVGRGIAASGVPRGEIFLTSKIWPADFSYQRAKRAIDATLRRLGVDYVDLLLLHQPYGDIDGAWQAMEEAKKEGKIRSAGVSNFTQEALSALLERHEEKPVINQVECHPFYQRKALRAFLKEHDILLQSWYPLGSGDPALFRNETLCSLAQKYGKSTAQIVLRWHVQEGFSVIPGSKNPVHIGENFDVFNFSLTGGEMDAIRALDKDRSAFRAPKFAQRIAFRTRMNFDRQK